MLDILTKSKIRQKIILLFLCNPKKEFYLSEIARAVETSAGTAQRELNRLLKSDLIVFKRKAGLNIYAVNSGYSLLGEVESIVKKTFGIEIELKRELAKIKNISFAFLFGSYAKGGFKAESDIDLFVIGDVDEDQVFKAVRAIENIIKREINYHITTRKEFSAKKKKNGFYKDILRDYVLLIGKNSEFRKFIK